MQRGIVMAKKSQPVDREATLAGIADGNTVLEYAANRDIISKETDHVMTSKRIPLDGSTFSKKGDAVVARNKSQPGVITANQKNQPIDWEALLAGIPGGMTVVEYTANRTIYRQGDPADAIFYLRRGKVKLTVTSQQGKE